MSAPSVSYSITIRLEVPAGGGAVSQLTATMEALGGSVTALDVIYSDADRLGIDVTLSATSTPTPTRSSKACAASTASCSARSPTVRS